MRLAQAATRGELKDVRQALRALASLEIIAIIIHNNTVIRLYIQ